MVVKLNKKISDGRIVYVEEIYAAAEHNITRRLW